MASLWSKLEYRRALEPCSVDSTQQLIASLNGPGQHFSQTEVAMTCATLLGFGPLTMLQTTSVKARLFRQTRVESCVTMKQRTHCQMMNIDIRYAGISMLIVALLSQLKLHTVQYRTRAAAAKEAMKLLHQFRSVKATSLLRILLSKQMVRKLKVTVTQIQF